MFNHPTVKPLDIIRNLVVNSSQEGDVVLDPYMGSGTTAAACALTGRRYLGFEIDPLYCKTIDRRLKSINAKTRSLDEFFGCDVNDQ